MARTAQISKGKQQSIITLRHEGQSIREHFKNFKSFFKCSHQNIKRYNETGSYEDCHRNGRPRVTSAAEGKFIKDQPQKLQPK